LLAPLAAEHELVVTHGNGPQVGLLALQSESFEDVPPYPLDVLGAETEGMIGYLLARELRGRIPNQEVATLLTQVEVDPRDAALQNPSKPIGPSYSASRAKELAENRGWTIVEESKGGFRRVVPSPEPKAILEVEVIRLLVSAGVLVTCAGGGGIPVARSADGTLYGVEAVVDKDLASALLATRLGADFLLLLTDQPAVFSDWPEPALRPIGSATVEELQALSFEQGTMGPKVEAACRFAAATGGSAAIGALTDAAKILNGSAGTQLRPVHRLRS
jgi:carbamate kinase